MAFSAIRTYRTRAISHATPGGSRCRFYNSGNFSGSYTSYYNTSEPTRGPLGSAPSTAAIKVTPKMLKDKLDEYIVAQDKPKRIFSTAVFQHYLRVQRLAEMENLEQREQVRRNSEAMGTADPRHDFTVLMDPSMVSKPRLTLAPIIPGNDTKFGIDPPLLLEKSNVLCLGPTGCGKTLIIRTLARIIDVPISISDSTPLTMAGYIGEDVEQLVHRLLVVSDYNVARAETGIIVLDEFDKLAKPKMSGTKDVSGEGVQQALLKMVEGTTLQLQVKDRRAQQPPAGPPGFPGATGAAGIPGTNLGGGGPSGGMKGETVTIDTSNMLFIFLGAFVGLDKYVSARFSTGSMGFNSSVKESTPIVNPLVPSKNILDETTPEDLIAFGLIPELIGRIPITTAVHPLTANDLVRVLIEPRNSLLKQYIHLFSVTGIQLRFTSGALHRIAKETEKLKTGARGLKTVIEKVLGDAMYETPGSSVKYVVVTEKSVHEAVSGKKGNGEGIEYFSRSQGGRASILIEKEEEELRLRGGNIFSGFWNEKDPENFVVRGHPALEEGEKQVAGYA